MTRAWPKLRRAVACRGNMQRRLAVLIEPDGCTCIPPSPADGPPSTRQRPADHISRASQGMHALCRRTNAMRGGAGGGYLGSGTILLHLSPPARLVPRALRPRRPIERERWPAGSGERARAGHSSMIVSSTTTRVAAGRGGRRASWRRHAERGSGRAGGISSLLHSPLLLPTSAASRTRCLARDRAVIMG
jgi:hypothetical protein